MATIPNPKTPFLSHHHHHHHHRYTYTYYKYVKLYFPSLPKCLINCLDLCINVIKHIPFHLCLLRNNGKKPYVIFSFRPIIHGQKHMQENPLQILKNIYRHKQAQISIHHPNFVQMMDRKFGKELDEGCRIFQFVFVREILQSKFQIC